MAAVKTTSVVVETLVTPSKRVQVTSVVVETLVTPQVSTVSQPIVFVVT